MKVAITRRKCQAVLLAALALAMGVQAEPVSQLQVSRAARTWAKAGRRFGVRIGNSVDDDWTAEVRVFDGENPVPAIQVIENHVKVSAALGAEANWTKATCTAEIRDGAAVITIQKPGADRGFMMIETQQSK